MSLRKRDYAADYSSSHKPAHREPLARQILPSRPDCLPADECTRAFYDSDG